MPTPIEGNREEQVLSEGMIMSPDTVPADAEPTRSSQLHTRSATRKCGANESSHVAR